MNHTESLVAAMDRAEVANASRLTSMTWSLFGVLAILGLATPNPWLTAAAMLVPPLLLGMLWRPGEPPILAFAAGFQWLQAASPILAANIEGRHISDQPFGSFQLKAIWLSLIAVVVLGSGMAFSLRRMKSLDLDVVRQFSFRLSSWRLFVAYLVSLVLSAGIIWLSMRAGGLRQPILALSSIKWVPLFLLCWSTLQCRKPKRLMLIALAIEIVIGFSGFFSTFKSVLFLLVIVAIGTSSDRPRLPKLQLTAVAALTLGLVAFWQAVKVDYRRYLNKGTGQQVVLVPLEQRLVFLIKSASSINLAKVEDGLIDGVRRLGYTHFFAHSIRHVPKSIPHENGSLWMGAVKHVFMPRIFFPNKAVLNDSERTAYYTGLRVAGAKQGTSISIGYIGESYIDFGQWFMMVPVFLLGCLYGTIYVQFVSRDPVHLIGFAFSTSILLFSALLIETSNIKLIGGLTASVLAFVGLHLFFRDNFLAKVMD